MLFKNKSNALEKTELYYLMRLYFQFETDYLDHIYTMHQDEIHVVTQEWRDLFDRFEEETGKHMYV